MLLISSRNWDKLRHWKQTLDEISRRYQPELATKFDSRLREFSCSVLDDAIIQRSTRQLL